MGNILVDGRIVGGPWVREMNALNACVWRADHVPRLMVAVILAVACAANGVVVGFAAAAETESHVRDFVVDGVRLGDRLEGFRRRFPKARAIRAAAGHPSGHQGFLLEGRGAADVPVAYGFSFIDGRLYEIRILWRKEDPGAPLLAAYYHSLFGVFEADVRLRRTTHEFPKVNRTVTVSTYRDLQIVAVADTTLAEEVGWRLARH